MSVGIIILLDDFMINNRLDKGTIQHSLRQSGRYEGSMNCNNIYFNYYLLRISGVSVTVMISYNNGQILISGPQDSYRIAAEKRNFITISHWDKIPTGEGCYYIKNVMFGKDDVKCGGPPDLTIDYRGKWNNITNLPDSITIKLNRLRTAVWDILIKDLIDRNCDKLRSFNEG